MIPSRRALLEGGLLGAGFGAVGLAGCAPYVQPPLAPPPGFAGPRLEAEAFIVQDGARLPCRLWAPQDVEPWAAIVALHGMNDHHMAWNIAGPAWAAMGIAVYACDQRGFGAAPGRGLWAGEVLMAEDLRTMTALVRARHPTATLAVAGESMGGAVAISAFASDRPPDADRLLLLAPAVWGWSSQSLLNRSSLWLAARLMGSLALEPPEFAVREIRATDNIDELIRMSRDPGFIRATRFDALSGLVDLMEQASRKLGRVRGPALLMYGAHDQIITAEPMRLALRRASDPPGLRTAFYPDGWHLLNRDLQAHRVFADAAVFLRDADTPLPSGAGPVFPD